MDRARGWKRGWGRARRIVHVVDDDVRSIRRVPAHISYGLLLAISRFAVVKNELSTAPMFTYQESGLGACGPGIEATEV